MKMKVTLRPLRIEDAAISYRWRNDPDVWKYTGSRPDRYITLEIEQEWIKNVLKRKNERRYAICVGESQEYIGNVQLTDITADSAQLHIFIGNKNYWGKGIGTEAASQMIEIGFKELCLKRIYLYVNKNNIAAIKIYEKCGFKIAGKKGEQIYMIVQNIIY